MRRHCVLLAMVFLVLVVLTSTVQLQAAPLKKVRASYAALAYANPPFWIAKDLGIFEKYGLDVDLSFVSGGKGINAMIGGSIDVAQVGGTATIPAATEGADVVILGTVFNRLVFTVHVAKEINNLNDLKGKIIATGTRGGNDYFGALVLINHLGWVLNRDVKIVFVGDTRAVMVSLQQGNVQGGILSPPTSFKAVEMGLREIFDIGSLNIPFPTISVVSTRKFVRENPEVTLNVLRATSEAVYIYKTRKDLAFPVIAKYMKISQDDPGIAQSYALYGKAMDETMTVSMDGIKYILDYLAEHENKPELAKKDPAEFTDIRFIKQLETEGFFKKLGK